MRYQPSRVMGGKESTLRHLQDTATETEDLSVLVLDMNENKAFGISPIQTVMKFAHERGIPEVRFINIAPKRGNFMADMIMRFALSIYPHITTTVERQSITSQPEGES